MTRSLFAERGVIFSSEGIAEDTKKRPREERKSSESHRSARTVVTGYLENPKMVLVAIAKVKKLGSLEDLRHPVPEAEFISLEDGYKQEAVETVYSFVKAVCQVVTALHRQNVGGRDAIWARQLD